MVLSGMRRLGKLDADLDVLVEYGVRRDPRLSGMALRLGDRLERPARSSTNYS